MPTSDEIWMKHALAEAAHGLGYVEPNPMVGAVVTLGGELISLGHHERYGGPHAEVVALARAGDRARGATLYVTLEPCCHHGKTPPCVDAILKAGIARVVAAHRDPFPQVDGGGLARLRAAGVEVTVDVQADAARMLNAPYLKRVKIGTPFVLAKWAMTLDGRIATSTGDSRWISNSRSRSLVHEVRGRMDAILIGVGTAMADDPVLTARPPGPRTPARVVLDTHGLTPIRSRLAQTASTVPVWIAASTQAPPERLSALEAVGCEVLRFDPLSGRLPLVPVLRELSRRGVTNLLVEGGGGVVGSFFDANQVDAVDVFIAPKLVGGPHCHSPVQGCGVALMLHAWELDEPEISQIEGNVRIRGRVKGAPWSNAIAAVTSDLRNS